MSSTPRDVYSQGGGILFYSYLTTHHHPHFADVELRLRRVRHQERGLGSGGTEIQIQVFLNHRHGASEAQFYFLRCLKGSVPVFLAVAVIVTDIPHCHENMLLQLRALVHTCQKRRSLRQLLGDVGEPPGFSLMSYDLGWFPAHLPNHQLQ